MIAAEVLLFSGNQFVGRWLTPIVWTGYILFVDGLMFKLKGRSLLITDRLEFVLIAIISIGGWWLCEFYNAPRFWKSDYEIWWHYPGSGAFRLLSQLILLNSCAPVVASCINRFDR